MKKWGMMGLVGVITLVSIIVIGIGTAPTLLLGPLIEAQAKASMSTAALYSGPRASMAANANNIYLTWWDNKTGNNEVYFGKSNDSGKSFGKPINLSDDKGGSADSQIAATPNNVYVTWWDNSTGNWEVFLAKSTDGGKTFDSPINISNTPDARSVGARMIAQGNNVYIAWMDIKPGQKQVIFRASNDSGQTFGNPIVVYDGSSSSAGGTTAPPSSSFSSSS